MSKKQTSENRENRKGVFLSVIFPPMDYYPMKNILNMAR